MSRSILLFAAVLLSACSSKPDLEKKKAHQDAIFELQYPGNWTLDVKDEVESGINMHTVSIEPSDGIAQVMSFTPAIPIDLEDFAMRLLKGMDAELSDYSVGGVELLGKVDGKQRAIKKTIAGAERDGLEISFAMNALNQKIPMMIELYTLSSDKTSAIVFFESANEDVVRDRPGFDLIFNSLRLK